MNAILLRAMVAAVRAWTRLYTRGLPPSRRDARRDEIESDVWESLNDPASDCRKQPLQMLVRLVVGVPDDLMWRSEEADVTSMRRWAVGLTVAAAAVLAFWLTREMRQPTDVAEMMRLVPAQPVGPRLIDAPPPPPPPPPPCLPEGFPRAPGPCTGSTR